MNSLTTHHSSLLEFGDNIRLAAGGEGQSVSSMESVSDCSTVTPAAARGNARSSQLKTRNPKSETRNVRSDIFAAASPVVVRHILELLGNDIPDPLAHARYLETLSFADLTARRDQLLREKNEQAATEELQRQPELPSRPLKQPGFFNGGGK
jgi:hypothetical protein